ncbi:MAG: chemotaxis protein CheB, partial [Gammaproteobacteria bacterium]|nr:chemotaxis protein CheB [Gammaproteobacteria bacterium]
SSTLPITMVVIQEIAPKILPSFAKQFAEQTSWRVEAGESGKELEQGVCYICSNETPLKIERDDKNKITLLTQAGDEQPLNALFTSASGIFGANTIGVLLTGIGDDGTEGFSTIRSNAGVTIAQSTDTCVYPNLTQCAIEDGNVDFIVDADELAKKIKSVVLADQ